MNLFLFVKLVKKIFCILCKKDHSMHDIIDLYQIIPQLNSDEFNRIEKKNKEISKHLENLKILKESIIKSLKKKLKKQLKI